MAKSLIICEKPSVAREYAKVLGASDKKDGYIQNEDYYITWCIGHLVTMSYPNVYDEKYDKWNLQDLPFLPDTYKYEVIKNVKDQYKIVKGLYEDVSKNNGEIILAGDSAREGIYIQVLVYNQIGLKKPTKTSVVWIDSFTESEIKRGLKDRKDISAYQNLIDAAYARAIEDYAVGINFTRVLSLKFGYERDGKYRHVQVGRVMTTVLGMIVRREREIKNFKETMFYKINAACAGFDAGWKAVENTKFYNSPRLYDNVGFLDKSDAETFKCHLDLDKHLTVEDVKTTTEKKKSPTLFNLAELQSECSKDYKIAPNKTLEIAQSLYEKKLTTYPRTDARVISTAVMDIIDTTLDGLVKMGVKVDEINYIKSTDYTALKTQKRYVDDSKISDHYAIIPTGEGSFSQLDDMEKQVYDKIVSRFIAMFYPAAEYEKTEVILKHIDNEYFFVSNKKLINKGYLAVYGQADDDATDDSKTIAVKKGDVINADFSLAEGKTSPPKRYTSGSIILAMENAGNLIDDEELRAQINGSGIGTSATRAEVISKLVSIKYIQLNNKTQVLSPDVDGEMVYDIVDSTIPLLLSPEMTASWEKGLSQIETGNIKKDDYIADINKYVTQYVEAVKTMTNTNINGNNVERKIIGKCPKCGGDLVSNSWGYGCSNYREKGCKFSIGNKIAGKEIPDNQIKKLLNEGITDVIEGFTSKAGKKFDAKLVLNGDRVEFKFEDAMKESNLLCPNCQSALKESKWSYKCDCGFSVYHTVAGVKISEKDMELLLDGKTTEKIKGFTSKAGKKFDTKLVMKDGKITFDFS